MSEQSDPKLGINSWLEDELYQTYLHDRKYVDESWKSVFEGNGHAQSSSPQSKNGTSQAVATACGADSLRPSNPRATGTNSRRFAESRGKSPKTWRSALSIPTATSQRIVQVRVLDENRQLINQHRAIIGKSKVSYTHIIGWAILRALDSSAR